MAKSTRELLEHARDFHRQLDEYFTRMSDASKRERVKMLLDHMARHEQRLQACMADVTSTTAERLLNYMFKFPPDTATCKCFESARITPDMDLDDVVEQALKLDHCLVTFYKQVAEECVSDEVRELFSNLLRMEVQHEKLIARDVLALQQL